MFYSHNACSDCCNEQIKVVAVLEDDDDDEDDTAAVPIYYYIGSKTQNISLIAILYSISIISFIMCIALDIFKFFN